MRCGLLNAFFQELTETVAALPQAKVGGPGTPSPRRSKAGAFLHAFLEHCLRQDLNRRAERRMGVLNPIKVVITNLPEEHDEELEAINNPEDPEAGSRKVPFSRELWIEAEDFREDPPKKYFRLAPGREVRLRWGFFIRCHDLVKDPESGEVVELRCTYDPATRGGDAPDGRKVKGTLHWVSVKHAINGEVRLYDRLFTDPTPDGHKDKNFLDFINPESLKMVTAKMEPGLKDVDPGGRYQFQRLGYFCVDADSSPGNPVFNRTVALRDTWAKILRAQQQKA